ncbi:MAG: TonB-dependent receptor [Leptolyngbyaceae cyanobacterium SM1_1_3]|nr:TonB-dependent receptor [Leptolyngbyaceae cyanobacterium SM1_1_3]
MIKYWIGMGAAGLFGLLLSQPANALDSQENSEVGGDETSLLITQPPVLSEVEQPHTTVNEWLEAQAEGAIAITNIQLNTTETGVDIILETQRQVAPTTSTLGNALIVEIPNAVLTIERFEQAEPAAGIALITAENLPENRVRIAITGADAAPAVAVRSDLQSLIVGITPGIAAADVSDEEPISIVVTAQKTPEDPLDVPLSLTVIPQQTLEDAQINDLTGISRNTPNFSFFPTNAGGSDFSYYSIRGLNNFNFLVSQDSVGYYIDDVPFDFGAFLDLGLLDLERVEVLRGPQSTLYGRSSPAGVVNIISRAPTNVSEFRAAGSYGNYNFRDVQLSYSDALIPDQLAFRLAGAYRARDGVFQNQTLDRSVGQREQLLGRAQLLWTPSEEWNVSFNTYVNDANNGDPVFTRQDADNPFETFKAVDGFVRLDSNTQALRIGYSGTGFRATSITARRFSRQEVLAGDSFSPPLDFARSNIDFSSTVWTQEIRLQSPENGDDRFRWLLGGYYESRAFDVGNDAVDYTALGAGFFGLPAAGQDRVIADLSRTTYAVFGQVDYSPVDPLTLFAGLRFESSNFDLDRQRVFQTADSVTVTNPRVQQADSSSEVIPRFGLQYRFSPNVMAYATIAKGYRPDGFNYRADTEDIRRYQEEITWTYETGVKLSWLDNRLTANLSIFHNDVQGYQVLLTDNFGFFRNIASADVNATGLEFEVAAQPLEGLDFVFGLGYVNSRFTRYQNPLTGADFNDNRVPFAPNITYNAAVQYRAPIGIFARLELQGYGTTFFDDANQVKQDPFALVNLRLGYEWQDYGVYLFANNLLDTRYITSGFQFPPPNITAGFGEPVTYGLQVRAAF